MLALQWCQRHLDESATNDVARAEGSTPMRRTERAPARSLVVVVLLLLLVGCGYTRELAEEPDEEVEVDCNSRHLAERRCLTLWELLKCGVSAGTNSMTFDAVTADAADPRVGLDRLLQREDVSLTLMVVPDLMYNSSTTARPGRISPGTPINGTTGGNAFSPTIAQYTFYSMLLPGDYSPFDLVDSAATPARTALYGAMVGEVKAGTAGRGTLALQFLRASRSSHGRMSVMEADIYPNGGLAQSTFVSLTQEACNGHLLVVDADLRRVVEVNDEGYLEAGSGGNAPTEFKRPMYLNEELLYQTVCNATIDQLFLVAALDARPMMPPPPLPANAAASVDAARESATPEMVSTTADWRSFSVAYDELYSQLLYGDEEVEEVEPLPLTSGMSFTLIASNAGMPRLGDLLPQDKWGKQDGEGEEDVQRKELREAAAWLLYTMLPGALCVDDLVAQGSVNTLLGLATGQRLSLIFSQKGEQVIVSTPQGYAIGTISETFTTCLSVLHTTRPVAGTRPPLLEVLPDNFRGHWGKFGDVNTATDVWKLISSLTRNYKGTPGRCANELPGLPDLELLGSPTPWPYYPTPPPPGPAPSPELAQPPVDLDSEAEPDEGGPMSLAVVLPVSIGVVLFIVGAMAGSCWSYRHYRQKQRWAAVAAAGGGGGGGGPSSSRGRAKAGSSSNSSGSPTIAVLASINGSGQKGSRGQLQDLVGKGGGGGSEDSVSIKVVDVIPASPLDTPPSDRGASAESSHPSKEGGLTQGNSTALPAHPSGTSAGGQSMGLTPTAPMGLVSASSAGGQSLRMENSSGSSRGIEQKPSLREALENVDHSWVIEESQLNLVRRIGQGSFGDVYVARWNASTVAAKKLPTELMEGPDEFKRALSSIKALQKEVSIMAGLRHPNVVLFMGVCMEPPMIVTEYCERGSLHNVLTGLSRGPSEQHDWRRRLGMALDAAVGMQFLAARGIVHCDLKSPNLLVDRSWHVKVADFGLSKLIDNSKSRTSLLVMNPRWIAPEVIMGGSHSVASDVFSFGVVLWELLTLDEPYEELNSIQVAFGVVNNGLRPAVPEDLSEVPGGRFEGLDEYVALMCECWSQAPADRPTFEDVAERLRLLRRGLAISRSASSALAATASAALAAGAASEDHLDLPVGFQPLEETSPSDNSQASGPSSDNSQASGHSNGGVAPLEHLFESSPQEEPLPVSKKLPIDRKQAGQLPEVSNGKSNSGMFSPFSNVQ